MHQQVHAYLSNGDAILTMTVLTPRTKQIVIETPRAILGCLAAEMESVFTKHGRGKFPFLNSLNRTKKFILFQLKKVMAKQIVLTSQMKVIVIPQPQPRPQTRRRPLTLILTIAKTGCLNVPIQNAFLIGERADKKKLNLL